MLVIGHLKPKTDDEMDALAVKMSPLMSSHNDQILLNQSLYKRIEILSINQIH